MNEQVEKLLTSTSNETFTTVARGVLGDQSATLVGKPTFTEITASHNDARTIGIVIVAGTASINAAKQKWSSVVKVIDTQAESGEAAIWVSPENEAKIYELGLFADADLSLRPAKAYSVETRDDRFSLLWLEDLSAAPQPPWMPDHLMNAAKHLGQFNGFHARQQTKLPLELGRDGFYTRWSNPEQLRKFEQLIDAKNDEHVAVAWGDTPVESGLELAVLFDRLLEKAKNLPHGLAFGDSHSRNMFPVGSSTVGIDWAGMSYEPFGCDVGVLAGSALTFGIDEAERGIENEPHVFASYIEGLKSAGWNGETDHVRIGYFAQFIGYLCAIGHAPIWIFEDESRRPFLEKRLGVKLEEVPKQMSPIVALIPKYVDELKGLLD